jgi:superfamily II DNA or RNA helicase
MRREEETQAALDRALVENRRLRAEVEQLKDALAGHSAPAPESASNDSGAVLCLPSASGIGEATAPADKGTKVAFFRSLFRGREDVYAERWRMKDGNWGYRPAGRKNWEAVLASKPEDRSKVDRQTRTLYPLTDEVIRLHLSGKKTVGIYPLLSDETCWLLAADFDKATWQEDALAFVATSKRLGLSAYLERSRSGNGGHVWTFFERPLPAALARKVGCAILTQTMEQRHHLGLDSYDRFFPNQDTMPKGGFGNLIALPLQWMPRQDGNSLFVDDSLRPYPDQWQLLASVRRVAADQVDWIVNDATRRGQVLGVRASISDAYFEEEPWTLPPSRKRTETPIQGPFPKSIEIVRSNLAFVPKDGLPEAMINRTIRLAAFQNPDFYKTQAMRLSTWDKPRIISCAEEFAQHVALPRGCFQDVSSLLKDYGVRVSVRDERCTGKPIDVTFRGVLHDEQAEAVRQALRYDEGVLCAPTAFGKTVVASKLIAERGVSTLVLVHRQQLLDQWRERLAVFLDLPIKTIGQIAGGKASRGGCIDVALLQSLQRKGEVKDFVAEYGHVIVDECHHLSAFSFEQIMKQVKAKYVLGLTATPNRKDGHHPIIFMQCGPMRFNLSARDAAAHSLVRHLALPRYTGFHAPADTAEFTIHDAYSALVTDPERNHQIITDILEVVRAGRTPLVLTSRKEHLDRLLVGLSSIEHVIILKGGMGKKQRQAAAEKLASIPDGVPRVILATGSYIGEGFDDSRLDTLFLTMPISWRGTLQQYVGRLHRIHDGKKVVRVYDYVDARVPMLARMYEKRLKGYRAIGYELEGEPENDAGVQGFIGGPQS